jgi:hypothetical protein
MAYKDKKKEREWYRRRQKSKKRREWARAYQKKYRQQAHVKAHLRKYGKAYRKTVKYQATQRAYKTSEHGKKLAREWMRKRRADPAFKKQELERARAYEKRRVREPVARRKYHRAYWKKRTQTDPSYLLLKQLRARFASALKNHAVGKKYGASKDLGIDWAAIIAHVGPCPGLRRLWHIDHIRPLAAFDFTKPDQIRAAFAPENHQWLPADRNMTKGAKCDR